MRAHLEKVEKLTGRRPAQLDAGGTMPEEVAHVWRWFLELHRCRGEGALTHTEILAWAQLEGIQPTPVELAAIRDFDRAYSKFRSSLAK